MTDPSSHDAAELRAALDQERAKSEAFAHLMHEIRTHLNGVIGTTGLLLGTELTIEQRALAKQIRGSGDALLDLLNNVLDYSRMEARAIEVEQVDFDLRRLIEEIGELLAERAYARGIELLVLVPSQIPTALRGDPTRLRQVLVNLLSNAIKFTSKGEVVLRASAESEAIDGAHVRFEVSDTGVGISPDGIERLFRPFSQVHEGKGYGGSGLGLSLTKRLVTAMRGDIGVTSEPGRGSTFWCVIPFERRAPPTERFSIPRVDVQGRRVLIASTSTTARLALREMVTSLRIECSLAPDAERALRLMREAARALTPFDVIILDENLGELDTPALVRAIDAEAMLSAARVVMLEYPGQRLQDPRIAARLAKPVRQSRLTTCLTTLLGSSVEKLRSADADAGPSSQRGAAVRWAPPSDGAVERRAPASPASRGSAAPASGPVLRGSNEGEALRVMLVEDNDVNQKIARVMIERRGYTVDVAKDGSEAIDLAVRKAYAAIVMDCQMPNVDGYAATKKIRDHEQQSGRARVPIIAMTANAGPGDRDRCIAAGMDDYLSKPIVVEELERALRKWTNRVAPSASARIDETPRVARPLPIDFAVLEGLRVMQPEGQPDLVEEVIRLFLEDAPRRLTAFRDAAKRGDLAAAASVAHGLKGSAGHLGAKALAAICGRFEEKVKTGTPFNVSFAVSALEEELERVRAALTDAQRRSKEARDSAAADRESDPPTRKWSG